MKMLDIGLPRPRAEWRAMTVSLLLDRRSYEGAV